MTTPCFADLGKQAKDLFNKNYYLGIVKLNVKTKTPQGVEFNLQGSSNNDPNKVSANLETKHSMKDYGLTFKENWNTNSTLVSEVTLEDQFTKGLKLGLNCSFTPKSGSKGATIKTAFKNDNVHINGNVDFNNMGPLLYGAAVFGYESWLAGGQASFDANNHKVTQTNFAIGYKTSEFVLHSNVLNGNEFSGSVYQKINSRLESSILLGYSLGSNSTYFGLGCVYKIDNTSSIRAKINNSCLVSFGFTHYLRPGISVHLCATIDGKNFNQGGHKLGLGIELEEKS